MRNLILNLLKGTLLSVLVFFSVSFLSLIYSIRHPEFHGELHFGFPYRYYHQFWLNGNDYPNYGGDFFNLLIDASICWLLVTGIYLLVSRIKKKL